MIKKTHTTDLQPIHHFMLWELYQFIFHWTAIKLKHISWFNFSHFHLILIMRKFCPQLSYVLVTRCRLAIHTSIPSQFKFNSKQVTIKCYKSAALWYIDKLSIIMPGIPRHWTNYKRCKGLTAHLSKIQPDMGFTAYQ